MTEEIDKLKVILCKPGERAEIVEIDDKLEAMQELVGGLIQEYMAKRLSNREQNMLNFVRRERFITLSKMESLGRPFMECLTISKWSSR